MKKISKLIALLLALMLVLTAFAACGSKASDDDDDDGEKTEQTDKPDKADKPDKDDKDNNDKDEDNKDKDEADGDEDAEEESGAVDGEDDVGDQTGSGSIVGEWTADVDMTDALLEDIGADKDYFGVNESFDMTMIATFTNDKVTIRFDEEKFKESMRVFLNVLVNYLADEYSMKQDELLEAMGYEDFDDYFEDVMKDFEASDFNTSGTYRTEGNKLYLAEDGEELDENSYIEYSISGSKMNWSKAYGDLADEFSGLPYTFKRNK